MLPRCRDAATAIIPFRLSDGGPGVARPPAGLGPGRQHDDSDDDAPVAAGRGGTMRMKYYDTFCPIGPVIATGLDGDNLRVQCRVNGAAEIDSSSSDMIFDVAHLVAWVSEVMALNPGDIISSGCPDVGEISVGDTVDVEVEGVGVLRNPVVADF